MWASVYVLIGHILSWIFIQMFKSFADFLNWGVFLLLSSKSSLYICTLDHDQVQDLQTFSTLCRLFLLTWLCPLMHRSFLILMKSSLPVFSFFACGLGIMQVFTCLFISFIVLALTVRAFVCFDTSTICSKDYYFLIHLSALLI